MKNLFLAILTIFSLSAYATPAETHHKSDGLSTTEISNSLSGNEQRVRNASVRVVTEHGHGSGGLIRYKDLTLVLTAHHVTDGALGKTYLVATETEQEWGVLVYKDPLNDMALLYLPKKFKYVDAMKWRPRSELISVGQTITYSGYPSWHSLMSFRGHVAGFETHPEAGRQIILQTYGWFGCSGSVIYDPDGKIIGVLWAVDVETRPSLQVQENMIWVSPRQNLDIDLALTSLCYSLPEKPRACK